MLNDLDEPKIRIEDDEIRAALFIRDNYEFFGLDGENCFELGVGDEIGRLGAYSRQDIGVNPNQFSEDFSAERREAREVTQGDRRLHYDEIVDPAVQPEAKKI